ncbi:MAG: right-handed parallel beta-helix repeat-containing protein [Sedimentisphaerales bacterium]|nr:right-handed parallel beta-helix repeat-containing protein [Sedimentisphaerales bacterium]
MRIVHANKIDESKTPSRQDANAVRHFLAQPGHKITNAVVLGLLPLLCATSSLPPATKAAPPNILRVAADGTAEFKSIQAAIDKAKPGSVIEIEPGRYQERVKINKPLTLAGAGWNKTTLIAGGLKANEFEQMQNILNLKMYSAKSQEQRDAVNKEFEQFDSKCRTPTLLVTDTSDVVIKDLKLTLPAQHSDRETSANIVEFSGAQATMSGCAVMAGAVHGIQVYNGSNVEIRGCLVAAVWNTGIAVVGGDAPGSAKIIDCDIRNCHHRGITIGQGVGSAVVERCRISGSAWHGIRYDHTSPTITDNLIFENARSGIYASGQTAATVTNNVFYDNEMTGMSCWFLNRDTIEGNTFVDNMRSGLEVLGASKPTIRKNIFAANPRGVFCGSIGSDSPDATSDGLVTLEHNIFWDNKERTEWWRPGPDGAESVKEEIHLNEDAGNIDTDPLFVDSLNNEFSLKPDSPARREKIGAADPIKLAGPWPLQPEEIAIIPQARTRDYRQWNKQGHDAIAAETSRTDIEIPSPPAASEPFTATVQLKDGLHIRAFIDGSDYIKIRGDSLWYQHKTWDLPGKWRDRGRNITHDEPTYINGNSWMPEWEDRISKPYRLPQTALPLETSDSIECMKIAGRGSVSVTETPKPENDYTLSIFLDDSRYNAAQWYEFAVRWGLGDPQQWNKLAQTSAPPAEKPVSNPIQTPPAGKSPLQRLIDAAQPGQTVTIPKGVQTEPIVIDKPIVLKGESRTNCVFEVTADCPAIFVDTKGKGIVTIEAVTIKWQLATSDRSEYPFAVAVKDAKTQVRNCCFLPLGDFKRCPVAIRSLGFSELAIDTCRFEGYEYTVCFGEGTKGEIRDSLVINSGHQGISLYSGATANITRNVVTGSKYHGVRSTGGTVNMNDNLIINNANRGVYLGNKSAAGVIANNVIIGNATGISGFARSQVKIENNIIADSTYAAVGMRDSCSLTIRDNILAGNQRGCIVFEEGGKGANSLSRNLFWQNEADTENLDKPTDAIDADPCFADAKAGDFSLKPGPALQSKQGLADPKPFTALWQRWSNRTNKSEPSGN